MKKYGILAFPAKHSLSPLIHNTGFEQLGIDSKYQIFEIPKEKLGGFIDKVRKEKISGLSVSMPHKKDIIKYLDEIDEISKKLDSVNTVYWKNGKLHGTNTDIYGILSPIKQSIKNGKLKIENGKLTIAILGAGGAAAAACFASKQISNNVTIFNRTEKKAETLANKFGINYSNIQKFKSKNYNIILQMTSVGMGDNSNDIIIPNIEFNKNQIIFESIYHPINTEFIKRANQSGSKTITGDKMLLAQASKQFELWTGKKFNEEKIIKKLCLKTKNA